VDKIISGDKEVRVIIYEERTHIDQILVVESLLFVGLNFIVCCLEFYMTTSAALLYVRVETLVKNVICNLLELCRIYVKISKQKYRSV